jgi:hypothetical protein
MPEARWATIGPLLGGFALIAIPTGLSEGGYLQPPLSDFLIALGVAAAGPCLLSTKWTRRHFKGWMHVALWWAVLSVLIGSGWAFGSKTVDPLVAFREEGEDNSRIIRFRENELTTTTLGDCPNFPCYRIRLVYLTLDANSPEAMFSISGNFPGCNGLGCWGRGLPFGEDCWGEVITPGADIRFLVLDAELPGLAVWVGVVQKLADLRYYKKQPDAPSLAISYAGCGSRRLEEERADNRAFMEQIRLVTPSQP